MPIKLTQGFRNIKPGDAKTLLIKKVAYDEKYQKCKVTFADETGGTCTETFTFVGKNGVNEVALGIFSTIFKCATHDFTDREVEPTDMEGLSIVADVYEQEVETDAGVRKYTHLRNFKEAEDDGDYDIDEFI